MELLEEVKKAIELCEQGRGTAQKLVKASPVQISIYNTFTIARRDLSDLQAVIEDVLGIYNKKEK